MPHQCLSFSALPPAIFLELNFLPFFFELHSIIDISAPTFRKFGYNTDKILDAYLSITFLFLESFIWLHNIIHSQVKKKVFSIQAEDHKLQDYVRVVLSLAMQAPSVLYLEFQNCLCHNRNRKIFSFLVSMARHCWEINTLCLAKS